MSVPSRRRVVGTAVAAVVLVACTPVTSTDGSSGTVPLTSGSSGPTTASASSVPPTPQTPLGLATGPGVSDTAITIGLVVDPSVDLGFAAGVRLWQQVVNTSGGLCGRTVDIVEGTEYAPLATMSAGLILAAEEDRADPIGDGAAADGVPVLTDTAATVSVGSGIIPVGATADVLAVNTLHYLATTGALAEGSTLGILSDGSRAAAEALAGARWWAGRNGVLISEHPRPPADWGDAEVVIAWNSPASVSAVLAAAPQALVVTDLRGFDRAATSDRIRVATVTPALGSDQPASAMVATTATAAGLDDPGPRLPAGYAVAGQFARLVLQACSAQDLTRPGLVQALVDVGPAAPDSLLGPSDPGPPATGTGPATTVSAVAIGDPSAPGGLRPLTWLVQDPTLVDYVAD